MGVDFYMFIYGVIGVMVCGVGFIDLVVVMKIGKIWFKVFEIIWIVCYGFL